MSVNKIFPVLNLTFLLTIALLVTLSVKTWTHPTYPFKVDGSTLVGSPKNLQKLDVSKPAYSKGAISRVVKANLFRKQRSQYTSLKSLPTEGPVTPKSTLPPPNLILKGILMLGGIKIAILEGDYSTLEDGKVTLKNVKKKSYSLGQVVGDFELTEIEKSWVILDDKKGQKIRLPLSTRAANKVIQREGTSLVHKKTEEKSPSLAPTKTNSKSLAATKTNSPSLAPAPVFRVSGASSPPPAQVHISGR